MVITKKRVEEILTQEMELDEQEIETLEYFISKKETLTMDEARALDDVFGVIRSYMGARAVEATLHAEMTRLGELYREDPEKVKKDHAYGVLLSAEYDV